MSQTGTRTGFVLSVVAVLLLGAACKRNHPPSVPEVSGRLVYRPGDTASLTATATDLDNDSLSYLFAWVDSGSAVWSENYASGATAFASHVYSAADTCLVKVKVQDDRGAQSGWSSAQTLRVGLFAPGIPERPEGCDSGVTAVACCCSTRAQSPYDEPVRIEYDWDDGLCDSCPPVPSGSPSTGAHVFYLPGIFHVRARAFDTLGLTSAWSESLQVRVVCRDTTPPAVSIVSPADGDWVRRGLIAVKAVATDDQIVTKVEFAIDGTLKGTDSIAEGDTFSYAWTDTAAQIPNQKFAVVTTACDAGGNRASDSVNITVKNEYLKWYWRDPVELSGMMTSVVVASDGAEEVVMSYCWGDFKFYTITAGNGDSKNSATTYYPEYDFSGHPALCAGTGHVIAGSEEGELYALTLPGLTRAWRWPNMPAESLEPFSSFGAPAISGNNIYVGRDEDVDSLYRLYKFTDAGGSVTQSAAYVLTGHSVVDAPAIGADGSVYFGTDSGYLIKIDANLTAPVWRAHLLPVGRIHGPIIGGEGTIYCGTDSCRLYAVRPDGVNRWTATLDGVAARPALGRSALFVGTDAGTVYSIDPATGAINWQRPHAQYYAFNTTPIVAANGYLYIQGDNDVLYCLSQADGTLIWTCDCNSYLPDGNRRGGTPRTKKLGLIEYDPNPSITAEGDIIVVGQRALFCVVGDGSQLDASAPWPKWQRDKLNTGNNGSARAGRRQTAPVGH